MYHFKEYELISNTKIKKNTNFINMFSSIIKKNRVNYTLPFIVVFIVSCFKFIYFLKINLKRHCFGYAWPKNVLFPVQNTYSLAILVLYEFWQSLASFYLSHASRKI